jgi:hypothetical protein
MSGGMGGVRKSGVALLLLLGLGPGVQAHPGHQTSAEVELVSGAGRLEISLVVHEPDLEQALNAKGGSTVSFAQSAEQRLDQQILDYLAKTFVVRGAAGAVARLTWVGKERDGHEDDVEPTWVLYFEAELVEGLAGATLRNGVFCELFDDQINVVQVRQGTAKHSLGFSPYHGEKPLLP